MSIDDLWEDDDFTFLKSVRIFVACTAGRLLDWSPLPLSMTCGYFAVDDGGIWYLGAKPANEIEQIFRRLRPDLGNVEPTVLARILTRLFTPLAAGHQWPQPLLTGDLLRDATRMHGKGYELRKGLKMQLRRISPPRVTGDRASGWRVVLCAAEGWMHEIGAVSRYEFSISADYEIASSSERVATEPFSRVPTIVY